MNNVTESGSHCVFPPCISWEVVACFRWIAVSALHMMMRADHLLPFWERGAWKAGGFVSTLFQPLSPKDAYILLCPQKPNLQAKRLPRTLLAMSSSRKYVVFPLGQAWYGLSLFSSQRRVQNYLTTRFLDCRPWCCSWTRCKGETEQEG